MDYSARFLANECCSEAIAPEINVNPFGDNGVYRCRVLVSRDNLPVAVLRIFVECDKDGYMLEQCFKELLCNESRVAVLYGQHLHIVDIASGRTLSVAFKDYVGHLYPLPDITADRLGEELLVATFLRVFRVNIHSGIVWRSAFNAIDGIIIEHVVGGVIYASGEYDPPGGWQPFRLSLATGKNLKSFFCRR